MFCRNCGHQLDDNMIVCPYCGTPVNADKPPYFQQPTPPYYRPQGMTCVLAVVGFILSFFIPIAGLVCSIIGRKKCRDENLEGGGLALAGIIISSITIGLSLLAIIAAFGIAGCSAAQIINGGGL